MWEWIRWALCWDHLRLLVWGQQKKADKVDSGCELPPPMPAATKMVFTPDCHTMAVCPLLAWHSFFVPAICQRQPSNLTHFLFILRLQAVHKSPMLSIAPPKFFFWLPTKTMHVFTISFIVSSPGSYRLLPASSIIIPFLIPCLVFLFVWLPPVPCIYIYTLVHSPHNVCFFVFKTLNTSFLYSTLHFHGSFKVLYFLSHPRSLSAWL